MVNRTLSILILLLIYSCGSTRLVEQNIELSDTRDINAYVTNAFLDNLDQIHIIDNRGTLTRYSQDLKPLYKYADNTLGSIQHVDVNNPLKTLVFHRDYGIVSYLDNTLALLRKADLQDWGFYDISTIASSNDGLIWLYDPTRNQILKVDDEGQVILSTNNLNDYNLEDLEPIKIVERDNKIFVYDAQFGIIIFDNLGQYLKVLPIKGISTFQTDGRNLYIYKEGKIIVYTIRLLEESKLDLGENIKASNVLISPKSIFYIYADGVDQKSRK